VANLKRREDEQHSILDYVLEDAQVAERDSTAATGRSSTST
jgi:hypothetical protein